MDRRLQQSQGWMKRGRTSGASGREDSMVPRSHSRDPELQAYEQCESMIGKKRAWVVTPFRWGRVCTEYSAAIAVIFAAEHNN